MRRLSQVLLGLLVCLLFAAAVGPFLIPVPSQGNTLLAEELADPDSHFIDLGELRVHYKEAGEGENALILLHGFAASVFSWREVMDPLANAGYRVVAFDRPAYGLTSRPMRGDWVGENPYSTQSQVDLTVALMDGLGIQRAILVGNSAGGTIATLVARQHPQRVRGLVLVAPAIYAGGGTPGWIRPLLSTPQMRRLGPLIVRRLLAQGPEMIQSAWQDPTGVTDEAIAGYTKPTLIQNWDRALWEATIASRVPDVSAKIPEIDLPVLVVTGDSDSWVPPDQSRRLAGELPQAQLEVLVACGHVPQEECPDQFLEATLPFLAKTP